MHTLREHWHVHSRRQPIFIADQMFELPTQLWRIVLEIANVWAKILIKQDDDDTDRQITNHKIEDTGEFTLSSDIMKADLNHREEVLHLDQPGCDTTLQTTRVPLWKKRSSANIFIAHTPLPNLRHPARAIARPLLKRQTSTINISCESDIVQGLPPSKAGGDDSVPQRKAGGDHNVPQHRKATFEDVKWFMKAIVSRKAPWLMISNENYSMVDVAWKLAIEAQDHQWALAVAPVAAPSVCQLPSGPSLIIYPQPPGAVSVDSVFCSSIGLMMILNPYNINS